MHGLTACLRRARRRGRHLRPRVGETDRVARKRVRNIDIARRLGFAPRRLTGIISRTNGLARPTPWRRPTFRPSTRWIPQPTKGVQG